MLKIRNPLHAHVGHLRRILGDRKVKIGLGAVLLVFVLANLVMFMAYRNRMPPHSSIAGTTVNNKTYSQVAQLPLLPSKVIFKTSYASKELTTKELGASLDWEKTRQVIGKQKSWLPVANLFGKHLYNVQVRYDQKTLNKTIAALGQEFARDSTDWSIDTSGEQAKLVSGKDGYQVDLGDLKKQTLQGFGQGSVTVPVKKVSPKVSEKQLQPLIDQLKAKQQVSLSYAYNGTTRKPSGKDIMSWYSVSSTSLALDKAKISSYLSGLGSGLGIRVQNVTDLTNSTAMALDKQTALTATITAAPKAVKQYTYCIRAKNVSESELPAFGAKVNSTLNDARGWSLDGQVSFSQVSSGCSMVMWLSAAADLPGFGAICDSTWSCTVRPNVIINYNRWTGASDAWNASGGSLDDYRSMVINHESGHWLGFGHRYCGGAGQPAPVMQQQSISLQGCTFNPWPSVAEKNTLRAQLGI